MDEFTLETEEEFFGTYLSASEEFVMSIDANVTASRAIAAARVDATDFKDFVTDMKLRSYSTASRSMYFKAHLKPGVVADAAESAWSKSGQPVFLKVQLVPETPDEDNSGQVEAETYLDVLDHLIEDGITPHLIPCLGYFFLRDFARQLADAPYTTDTWERDVKNRTIETYQNLFQKDEEPTVFDSACVLVLQDVAGVSVFDSGSEIRYQAGIAESVVMQTLYTLEAFNRAGVRHNDLHQKNIMLEDVGLTYDPEPYLTYVVSENDAFRVPTYGRFVRIFDFDLAHNGVLENTRLAQPHMCAPTGICDVSNPAFDTHFFLRWMSDVVNNERRMPPLYRPVSAYHAGGEFDVNPQQKLCNVLTDYDQRLARTQAFNAVENKRTREDVRAQRKVGRDKRPNSLSACYGEITSDALMSLDLPPTLRLVVSQGDDKGWRVSLDSVDLDSPTTFVVSERLRTALTGKKQAAPKAPTISRATCDGVGAGSGARSVSFVGRLLASVFRANQRPVEDAVAWALYLKIHNNKVRLDATTIAIEQFVNFVKVNAELPAEPRIVAYAMFKACGALVWGEGDEAVRDELHGIQSALDLWNGKEWKGRTDLSEATALKPVIDAVTSDMFTGWLARPPVPTAFQLALECHDVTDEAVNAVRVNLRRLAVTVEAYEAPPMERARYAVDVACGRQPRPNGALARALTTPPRATPFTEGVLRFFNATASPGFSQKRFVSAFRSTPAP